MIKLNYEAGLAGDNYIDKLILFENRMTLEELVKLLNTKFLRVKLLTSKIVMINNEQYLKEIETFNSFRSICKEIIVKETYSFQKLTIQMDKIIHLNLPDINTNPLWDANLIHFNKCSVLVLRMCHSLVDVAAFNKLTKCLCDSDKHCNNIKEFEDFFRLNINQSSKVHNKNPYQNSYFIHQFYLLCHIIFVILVYFPSVIAWLVSIIRSMKARTEITHESTIEYKTSSTIEIPLDLINKQRKQYPFHVTVNDYLLCLISHSFAQIIKNSKHKKELIKLFQPIIIPVNLRRYYDTTIYHDFGNVISGVVYILPLMECLSFEQRLKIIQKEMNWHKKVQTWNISYFLGIIQDIIKKVFLPANLRTEPTVFNALTNFPPIHGDLVMSGHKIKKIMYNLFTTVKNKNLKKSQCQIVVQTYKKNIWLMIVFNCFQNFAQNVTSERICNEIMNVMEQQNK